MEKLKKNKKPKQKKELKIKKGMIFMADLDPTIGSEQQGIRPVVVIQNNLGNDKSSTVIIAPLSTKVDKDKYPFHVYAPKNKCHIDNDSYILLEQVRTIDKKRLIRPMGLCSDEIMNDVSKAIKVCLEL